MIELNEYVGSIPRQITKPDVISEEDVVVETEDVEQQETKDKE